jgi:hypothetical protein
MAFPREAIERACQDNNAAVLRHPRKPKDTRSEFEKVAGHMFDEKHPERRPTLLAESDGTVLSGVAGNARDVTSGEIAQFKRTGVLVPSDQRWIGPQFKLEEDGGAPTRIKPNYKAIRETRERDRKEAAKNKSRRSKAGGRNRGERSAQGQTQGR